MAGSVAQSAEQEPLSSRSWVRFPPDPLKMFSKSLKITSVSGINFIAKNFLVFLTFDFLNILMKSFIFNFDLHIHSKLILIQRFTLKKEIGTNSFTLFTKLNLILFLIDYIIFNLIKSFFPLVVVSTMFITVFVHTIRIFLFSKEMNE